MESASCASVDPELFFTPKGGNSRPAVTICKRCPVIEQCLTYSLDIDAQLPYRLTGVWGGITENGRRELAGMAPRVKKRPGAPHGTPAAERAHYRASEQPCVFCRQASLVRRSIEASIA